MGFHEEMIEYDPAPVFTKMPALGMTTDFLFQHYVFVLRELTKIAVEAREKLSHCMADEVDRVSCHFPECGC